MSQGAVWYMIVSALLIIAFTFFYSSISFDPKQQAEQLQQQGAVIPGQRGKNIRQYLQNIVSRLNLFAAFFLAILAAVPTLLITLAGVNPNDIPFAASSILIAVSVSLETVRTIQGEMSVRGIDMDMGNLVIIELKRDGLCYSPVLEMLRQLHIHPHGFSKYCMGSALTNQHLPIHRFKSKLREINNIMERKH